MILMRRVIMIIAARGCHLLLAHGPLYPAQRKLRPWFQLLRLRQGCTPRSEVAGDLTARSRS